MKKVFVWLMILALVLMGAAAAEEFSLRGVRFGMSLDEVQAAEGSKGHVITPSRGVKVVYVPSELEGVAIGRASSDVLTYEFRYGTLYEIQFWSGYYETEEEAQVAFDTWEAMIETRYGDCIDETEPTSDTRSLTFYKEFYKGFEQDFENKCVRLRKIGLTVEGQQIIVDLFILPSVDDFETFCVIDSLDDR